MTTATARNDQAEQAFTISDLMARWKMSRKAILEAIADGKIQAFRIGRRHFRVAAAEVARVEASQAGVKAAND